MPLGGGIRATPDQLLSLGVAIVLVVAVHLLLSRTAIGRAMRAVSENPGLAGVAGVEVRKVIRIVWLLGAALACIAGISAGLIVQIRPQMGLDLLLPLFAAAILGGIGSVPGAMLAGVIVGLAKLSPCSSSAPNGARRLPSSSSCWCCFSARRASSEGG